MTQTATASGTLTVMANLPLSVSLIVNPTTINLGQSVTLTASVTGEQAHIHTSGLIFRHPVQELLILQPVHRTYLVCITYLFR